MSSPVPSLRPSLPRLTRAGGVVLLGLVWVIAAGGCALTRKPKDGGAMEMSQVIEQAAQAQQQGDQRRASLLLNQGVRSYPENEEIRWALVKLLLDRGEIDEATRHLQILVANDPDDVRGYVGLARTLYDQHRYGDADRVVSIALEHNPNLSEALVLKGLLDEVWGETDRALQHYHRALQGRPPPAEALLRIAAIQSVRGKPEQAVALLREAQDSGCRLSAEQRHEASWSLGVAYARLQRWPEAVAALAEGVSTSAPTAEQMYHLAYARMQAGDTAGATRDIAAALQLQPQHPPSQALWAQLTNSSPPAGGVQQAQLLPAGHEQVRR